MDRLEKSYTFDDVLLVPDYAEFEREDVNIGSSLFDEFYKVPIISSPMDTITGLEMMDAMSNAGGLGIHHRYCDLATLTRALWHGGIAVSPSMGIEMLKNLAQTDVETLVCVLDVAHGDTKKNIEFCAEMINIGVHVVSGNIVTPWAVERYLKAGVNTFRVGIGSGSVCTTRSVAGVGFPQAHAIRMLRQAFDTEITIISDGGCKTTGDIVKALALGADFVMLGGMLAGTDEALGTINVDKAIIRGMASKDAVFEFKGGDDGFIAEGINKEVKPKGSVASVMKEIEKAIKLGCYYTGSRNLDELHGCDITYITENAYLEGLAR